MTFPAYVPAQHRHAVQKLIREIQYLEGLREMGHSDLETAIEEAREAIDGYCSDYSECKPVAEAKTV